MITVECPECNSRFYTKEESAGKQTKCPSCGKLFTVSPIESPPAQPRRTAIWILSILLLFTTTLNVFLIFQPAAHATAEAVTPDRTSNQSGQSGDIEMRAKHQLVMANIMIDWFLCIEDVRDKIAKLPESLSEKDFLNAMAKEMRGLSLNFEIAATSINHQAQFDDPYWISDKNVAIVEQIPGFLPEHCRLQLARTASAISAYAMMSQQQLAGKKGLKISYPPFGAIMTAFHYSHPSSAWKGVDAKYHTPLPKSKQDILDKIARQTLEGLVGMQN